MIVERWSDMNPPRRTVRVVVTDYDIRVMHADDLAGLQLACDLIWEIGLRYPESGCDVHEGTAEEISTAPKRLPQAN